MIGANPGTTRFCLTRCGVGRTPRGLAFVLSLAVALAGCSSPTAPADDAAPANQPEPTKATESTPVPAPVAEPVATPVPAAPATPVPEPVEERYVYAEMTTSMGTIVLELDKEKAPVSVANFAQYATDGAYDGTIFHRVISNFMIQGGGFTPDMAKRNTRPGIVNEWQNGLSNVRGSIAMARLGGQANSGTNQFFINVQDNAFLDQPRDGSGYAVFGRVVSGIEVVDAIKSVPTGVKNGMGDVPVEAVVIERVRVLSPEASAPYRNG